MSSQNILTCGEVLAGIRSASDADLSSIHELYDHPCKGQRNSHLTKIVGKAIRCGMPLEKIILIAQNWNSGNKTPLPDREVEKTCRSIQRTHDRNNIEPSSHTPEDKVPPLFQLQEASISRFIGREPPPRRWLIKDSLPVGKVGMLVAPGGSSKSQFALQLAASVATGVPVAGNWQIGETGGVLCLFAEDDEEEIHRRTDTVVSHLMLDVDVVRNLEKRLFIRPMVGCDNLLTRAHPDGEVKTTEYVERLLATVADIPDLRLIVLDPASRFRGGQENANEDATRFVEALERIAQHTGATVLILHHANKGSSSSDEQSQTASRGASALTDGVRWQMNLRTLTQREAREYAIPEDRRRFYLLAEVTKNNYGPPAAPTLLSRGDGGYLTAAMGVALPGPKRDLLRVLKAIQALPNAISCREFEERHAGVNSPLTFGKLRARKLISEAIEDGLLQKGHKHKLSLTEKGEKFIRCDGLLTPTPRIRRSELHQRTKSVANTVS